MTERRLSAIVLAAGEGTRMKSSRPKPLHLLAGRSMLQYVLDSLADCQAGQVVVVVGHAAERVTKKLQADASELPLTFVEQHTQLGTGDAASVGLTGLPDDDGPEADDHDVLVMPGDMPLLRPATIAELVATHRELDAACTVLTARVPEPGSYGRVVRGADGAVLRIVEAADASDDERAIDEINTAVYCFRRSLLAPALRRITPENAQGEFYLTDVVAVLRDAGYRVAAVTVPDAAEG
jgi:bifunctional UDP-N-acetylglucosamine pyrophosphorylase/glucosamine-1-phosphate N-acetyltransferase